MNMAEKTPVVAGAPEAAMQAVLIKNYSTLGEAIEAAGYGGRL